MKSHSADPRLILGLKLRRLRQATGRTLSDVSQASGLSISYLSEIEKGKKYPKPEKMLALAEALEVPFDELVSLTVTDELSPLKAALNSPFLREFPFDLFGVESGDILSLVNDQPTRAAALFRALLEVGQSFDVTVETFLLAAMRAYQQMNWNYFEEIEEAAAEFRSRSGWAAGEPVSADELAATLEERFAYTLDFDRLSADAELSSFRSVFRPGPRSVLYVNGELLPSQRAFVLAREVGYEVLGLEERALTSSWVEVESFDQVLNNFKASYFSGALLLDRGTVVDDLSTFFAHPTWQPDLLLSAMERFDATPETYFTRMTQLVPKQFGLKEMYFLRMTTQTGGGVELTKLLNTSPLPLTAGLGLDEHYCRRWASLKFLADGPSDAGPRLAAQRAHFLEADLEFLAVSTVRPLALDHHRSSSVTVAWRLDRRFRKVAAFADDPEIPEVEVNLTCERCPLDAETCRDRVAEPAIVAAELTREAKRSALRTLDG